MTNGQVPGTKTGGAQHTEWLRLGYHLRLPVAREWHGKKSSWEGGGIEEP